MKILNEAESLFLICSKLNPNQNPQKIAEVSRRIRNFILSLNLSQFEDIK